MSALTNLPSTSYLFDITSTETLKRVEKSLSLLDNLTLTRIRTRSDFPNVVCMTLDHSTENAQTYYFYLLASSTTKVAQSLFKSTSPTKDEKNFLAVIKHQMAYQQQTFTLTCNDLGSIEPEKEKEAADRIILLLATRILKSLSLMFAVPSNNPREFTYAIHIDPSQKGYQVNLAFELSEEAIKAILNTPKSHIK
jgi:hypothetical protein